MNPSAAYSQGRVERGSAPRNEDRSIHRLSLGPQCQLGPALPEECCQDTTYFLYISEI